MQLQFQNWKSYNVVDLDKVKSEVLRNWNSVEIGDIRRKQVIDYLVFCFNPKRNLDFEEKIGTIK
jgi:hypothetical protein